MTTSFYSLSEVARLLGVKGYRIDYAHKTGSIPEPMRFCGKRVYRGTDVERIASHFGVSWKGTTCTNTG